MQDQGAESLPLQPAPPETEENATERLGKHVQRLRKSIMQKNSHGRFHNVADGTRIIYGAACDKCRVRKTKCSGWREGLSCDGCLKKGIVCSNTLSKVSQRDPTPFGDSPSPSEPPGGSSPITTPPTPPEQSGSNVALQTKQTRHVALVQSRPCVGPRPHASRRQEEVDSLTDELLEEEDGGPVCDICAVQDSPRWKIGISCGGCQKFRGISDNMKLQGYIRVQPERPLSPDSDEEEEHINTRDPITPRSTSEGAYKPSVKTVYTACDTCRHRRIKCVGWSKSSSCQKCFSRGLPCVNTHPRRRENPVPYEESDDAQEFPTPESLKSKSPPGSPGMSPERPKRALDDTLPSPIAMPEITKHIKLVHHSQVSQLRADRFPKVINTSKLDGMVPPKQATSSQIAHSEPSLSIRNLSTSRSTLESSDNKPVLPQKRELESNDAFLTIKPWRTSIFRP